MAKPEPNLNARKSIQTLDVDYLENKAAQIYHQVEELIKTQMELAITEISEKIDQVKKGTGSVLFGGALSLYGGQIIAFGLVLLLDLWVDSLWLSSFIIGGGVLLIGFIMMKAGKKSLDPANLKPEKTMRSIQRETEAISRRTQ